MTDARKPLTAIGVMSGTSLDGVTAALARFERRQGGDFGVTLLAHITVPYGAERSGRISSAIARGGPRELALLHHDLGEWFADAVASLLSSTPVPRSEVAFVASHGQTIWHEPRRATLQLGSPAVIAERTGLPVISDFRARDVAAGGHGAPLVPRADRLLFARADGPRVLLNVGGIANMSLVPAQGDDSPVVAFDTGPGVMVIDACVRRLFPGARFDDGGRIAASGKAHHEVVAECLKHPFFGEAPPKTTGRETFGDAYAEGLIAHCLARSESPEDVVATATALTARSIADAATRFLPAARVPLDVIRSGGGARNPALVAALAAAWPGVEHRSFDDVFFDGDAKEAVAFAFLGCLCRLGVAGNEPGATGAEGPRLLGSTTRP